MLLVLAMLTAYVPVGFAEENEALPAAEAEEMIEAPAVEMEPEEPEEAEEPEEPEQAELPEEAGEPEETEEPEQAEEPEEAELPEQEEASVPEELEVEEEEKAPAFEITVDEKDRKAQLAENTVPAVLAELTEGVDYKAGEVLVLTDSEAYAQSVAEAYHGTLRSYAAEVGIIALTDLTVLEAVALAADPDSGLPAVYPNYRLQMKENFQSEIDPSGADAMGDWAPSRMDWYTIVKQIFTNPDPMLLDPAGDDYQWHHDVLNSYAAWGVVSGMTDPSKMLIGVISSGVDNRNGELPWLNTSRGTNLLGNAAYYEDLGGTAAAGIIAAKCDNGKGGAGVAPSSVGVVSYNVTDADGYYYTSDVTAAILDAAKVNNLWVIYIGLVEYSYDAAYEAAIQTAGRYGVTVVAPVGNNNSNTKSYPAAYDGVIGVAGTTRAGTRQKNSNYGKYVDLSAPGDYIPMYIGEKTLYWSGSYPAAAMVAGAAALYMCNRGVTSPKDMLKVLQKGTQKATGDGLGAGILDLEKMLESGTAAPKIRVLDKYDSVVATSSLDEEENTDEVLEPDREDAQTQESSGWIGPVNGGGGGTVIPTNPEVGNGAQSVKIPAKKVSSEDYLTITQPNSPNDMILLTYDGSNPAVLNGEIVNGYTYPGPVPLNIFGPGEVVFKAISISGTGKVSKMATIKLNIQKDGKPESIDVTAPASMIAGSSVTLTAAVKPETAVQSVSWRIVSRSGCSGASIDSKGKLTTEKYQTGWVKVRATSTVDSKVYSTDVTIQIKNGSLVKTVKLDQTNLCLYVFENEDEDGTVNRVYYTTVLTPMFLDQDGRVLSNVSYTVTSSDPKVAVAEKQSNGKFEVLIGAAGTATLTCKALDGSNKTAACKVTVKDSCVDFNLVGQTSIAPGSSATYKMETTPKTKLKYTWSLKDAPYGVSINEKTGKVTVAGYATVNPSKTFRVYCTPSDGEYPYMYYKDVSICQKASKVQIYDFDEKLSWPQDWNYDKNYNLKDVTIYSTEALETKLSSGAYNNSNFVVLKGAMSGSQINSKVGNLLWSSSKPEVARVVLLSNGEAAVFGQKSGTAKITCKANDGSGKSASVTVKVVTPASSIEVVGPVDVAVVNYGKSITAKAAFGNAYGMPSVTDVNWEVAKVYENVEKSDGTVSQYDRTGEALSRGLVSISSKGKLSVKKNADNLLRYYGSYLSIVYGATTKDGTNLSSFISIEARPAVKSLDISRKSVQFWLNNRYDTEEFIPIYYSGADNACPYIAVKSSNPDVASGVLGQNSQGIYGVYIKKGTKKGSAKLTVFTRDTAKKSTTISVKVVS